MSPYRGLLGIIVIFFIAFLCSSSRKNINWTTVLRALFLQVFIGAIVLYFSLGVSFLESVSRGVLAVFHYADNGISFLFGEIADKDKYGIIFAIDVLGVIVFFSSLIAVLYYFGIMQCVIRFLGGGLNKILKVSNVESIYVVANIFLGQSESPIAIKPYVKSLTQSEMFTVMTSGMAAVAGTILFGYVALGVEMKHLLAASFMAVPGAVLMSKMIVPEIAANRCREHVHIQHDKYENVFDAAAQGAVTGVGLVLNIGAMLLAFTALIAMCNDMVGIIATWFGFENMTLVKLMGFVFMPVAWIIGIPLHESQIVGGLLGEKVLINEFMAYKSMFDITQEVSTYSKAVASFALCGFANFSSIAIQLAIFGNIAPERRNDVARLGVRALLAGTLSNLMSASIAAFFMALSG